MRVVLIRHPEPLVDPGICYGRRLDLALTVKGLRTAAELGANPILTGSKRVWSSPAQRCRIAAEMIAETLQLPLSIDPRLHEFDFGEWEGRKWDDIPRAEFDRWAAEPLTFRPPGGETAQELVDRTTDFVNDRLLANEDCVIVSHGGPLKVLNAQFRGEKSDPLAPSLVFGVPTVIDPVAAANRVQISADRPV
jgi:alpha-ribazole phosphatase